MRFDSPAPGSAPMATMIALVATLCATSVAIALVVSRSELTARETAAFLLLFSVLFLLRVAGQALVVLRAPAWLPPMHQWHLMPYRILLPTQIGFLALMVLIEMSLLRGWAPIGGREHAFGRFLIGFSFLYAGVMAVRYAARMYRRPGERWFGGAIPIVFHFVLAAFLFTWGRYNVSG
ncbi:MAG: hypothetical protein ABJB95_08830 [Gemmatimonadales bacterium]